MKHIKTSIVALASLLMCGCGGTEINSIEDTIASVEDGGTIVLNSGLTVHLCGIDPNNSYCKEQLQKFVNHDVVLTAESEDEQTISSYDDEIDAYVRTSDGLDLNRYLLSSAGERALYRANCSDSIASFEALVKKSTVNLDDVQMCAMLRSCSMLVYGTDESGQIWVGTAFFISKDGLALSCNHVLNHGTINKVCISNSKGEINKEQGYSINSIAHADSNLDYVIFYVNLDDAARRTLQYMPLANEDQPGGTKVGVMGNPLGDSLLMSYSSGTVSGDRSEAGKIQINAPITHGYSGGPVCNNKGEIIGIAQSGIETSESGTIANLNFAVDILQVRQWLDDHNLSYAGK